jgi:hypothetical protein
VCRSTACRRPPSSCPPHLRHQCLRRCAIHCYCCYCAVLATQAACLHRNAAHCPIASIDLIACTSFLLRYWQRDILCPHTAWSKLLISASCSCTVLSLGFVVWQVTRPLTACGDLRDLHRGNVHNGDASSLLATWLKDVHCFLLAVKDIWFYSCRHFAQVYRVRAQRASLLSLLDWNIIVFLGNLAAVVFCNMLTLAAFSSFPRSDWYVRLRPSRKDYMR